MAAVFYFSKCSFFRVLPFIFGHTKNKKTVGVDNTDIIYVTFSHDNAAAAYVFYSEFKA